MQRPLWFCHMFCWLFAFHSAIRDIILQCPAHGRTAFWARGRVPEIHIRAQHPMMFTWFMIVSTSVGWPDWRGMGGRLPLESEAALV